MAAATENITLQMLLAETTRIGRIMECHYPERIAQGRLTKRESDQRLKINAKLVQILTAALKQKKASKKNLHQLLMELK